MPDLAYLPGGTSVFVDTNIFHYHFQGLSVTCTAFIDRVANHEIEAYVNTQVLSDLLHKLMMSEAIRKNCMKKGSNPQALKKYLKGIRGQPNPLGDCEIQFASVLAFGVQVLPINEKLFLDTKNDRQHYYLMTGDSLHLGTMNRRNVPLQDIVTKDADFALIPGITAWMPMDTPGDEINTTKVTS